MSDVKPEDYSCEVLLEKTSQDDARNTSFPTDAYNVEYTVEGEDRLDAVSYTHLTLPTNREV